MAGNRDGEPRPRCPTIRLFRSASLTPTMPRPDDVRRRRDQFSRVLVKSGSVVCAPANVHSDVATVGPAQFLQPLQEGRKSSLSFRIICRQVHKYADAAGPLALLRARAASGHAVAAPPSERDELAALSFDHLVGAREHGRRQFKAEGSGGLAVERENETCRLLYGKVGGSRSLGNAVDIVGRPPKCDREGPAHRTSAHRHPHRFCR